MAAPAGKPGSWIGSFPSPPVISPNAECATTAIPAAAKRRLRQEREHHMFDPPSDFRLGRFYDAKGSTTGCFLLVSQLFGSVDHFKKLLAVAVWILANASLSDFLDGAIRKVSLELRIP